MPLILTHTASAAGTHSAFRDRLRSLLTRLTAAVMQEIRMRRDMRLLSGLGEAALHDIGLTRGGVEDAVRHGRAEMPGLDFIGLEPSDAPKTTSLPSSETEWR